MSEDLRSPTVVAIEVANKELATIQEKILAAGRKSDERKELKAKAENLEADIERLRAELATERDSAPEEATANPTGPNETAPPTVALANAHKEWPLHSLIPGERGALFNGTLPIAAVTAPAVVALAKTGIAS